jgi:hypothetical protein
MARRRRRVEIELEAVPGLSPDEITRIAFPELSRCDHCGEFDAKPIRTTGGNGTVWLHDLCRPKFQPTPSTPVLYQPGQGYHTDPEQKGRIVGALVRIAPGHFEAYRYAQHRKGEPLGKAEDAMGALKLFAGSHHSIPRGPRGKIRDDLNGHSESLPSIRWCGGVRKCACYDDGEITAHKFRWEWSEPALRFVRRAR